MWVLCPWPYLLSFFLKVKLPCPVTLADPACRSLSRSDPIIPEATHRESHHFVTEEKSNGRTFSTVLSCGFLKMFLYFIPSIKMHIKCQDPSRFLFSLPLSGPRQWAAQYSSFQIKTGGGVCGTELLKKQEYLQCKFLFQL